MKNPEHLDNMSQYCQDDAAVQALQQSEAALVRRERFLEVLVAIQTCLLRDSQEADLFSRVLAPLGRVSGASRVYLFENHLNSEGQLCMSQRAEWCDGDTHPELHNPVLQNLRYADFFPRWASHLARGEIINSPIAALPACEQAILEPQKILSILIFPLTVNSEFWGFIGFDNCHEARKWDALEENLLGSAASVISMALERKQANDRLQQQAERDRLLGAIALRIRQSLNLEEILHRTVDEIRQFLHTDRVLIYRFDGHHGVLVAASVAPAWEIDHQQDCHQIWYRDENAVYENGQTYVVNNIEQQGLPHDYLDFMQKLQVKAKLVVPIVQSNHSPLKQIFRPSEKLQPSEVKEITTPSGLVEPNYLWGVLAVHHCERSRQWQPFEIDLLQNLAVQVAIAIQQGQLFSQVQQQAQREQLLNQLSHALNSSLDLDTILQEIVEQTGNGFGVDRTVIFLIDKDIRAINEWRSTAEIPSMLGFKVPISEWPDLLDPNSDFNQGRAFYTLDLSMHATTSAIRWQAIELESRSVLSVPVFIRDRLFGALSLVTTTCYRTFTTEEVQFLHRIASHAAIALYNAQSYEYLEQLVKQRTQELEQEKLVSETANRSKSEFLATMSHELRTPLNAILGLSQILQRKILGSLDSKQLEYINHIHSSGEHLLMLINDILDLAKVESGRETITPTLLSVPNLCDYCLTLVQEQAHEHGLQLICDLDPTIQHCKADERRLKQMLLNLLSNAIKFTPAGTVTLSVYKDSNGLAICVKDTGIGIAPEKLSLLFQPFSQLDSQLSRRYPGTGLGLALSRKLARLHGGDISVRSVLNQGSEFTLQLPDALDEAWCSTDTNGSLSIPCLKNQLSTGRVLIVEDDLCSATLLQDYLQAVGYEVHHVAESTQFLSAVQAFKPDLILMDVQLSSQVTGLDLLKQLRDQPNFEQLPVVMVTAMAMAGDREKFLQAGATDYLSKPLDIAQLELILMDHISIRTTH